ncbi:sialidase family protein [Flavilitoribacter nigricans]|uniref:Exo-alpha-sialidase n=1 Tax=Flavilitoribacter nigricans (strain ATCC 23147 / DSM 23189 / NBRC 102662 / NCIMB 1420 / SS-2) TaxID=1122177 RepID=A0A2D0MWK8_FLAN2|nr:sialidase family protein [Flavilitoribacter nigricans]PHN00570.1 hypothetical protein CRP01_41535 [Flavilitoribacter nigricans DSM 23189 = NBRC 102662]
MIILKPNLSCKSLSTYLFFYFLLTVCANIEAQNIQVSTSDGVAESAIKVNPVHPNIIVAGSNFRDSGQGLYYSSDGGMSWSVSSYPSANYSGDPTIDWSSDGQLAFTAMLTNCGGGCELWFLRSGDNGRSWADLPGNPQRVLSSNNVDKEYLHVDKHRTSPHVDNIYITWTFNGGPAVGRLQFARSLDRGRTWEPTISFTGDPRGFGSDITTDAAGNLYYVWHAYEEREIVLKRSTNGGGSFINGTITIAETSPTSQQTNGIPIPAQETRRAWIVPSADTDLSDSPYRGSIYVAWSDSYDAVDVNNPANNHMRVRVARSRNGGLNWQTVTPHPTFDRATVDRWHPWITVDNRGTVHIVYYDTRRSNNRTGVDLYYSYSRDGAETFSTPVRLTDRTSPNVVNDNFEFGDYNGADHLPDRVIGIYTDNRSGNSKDIYVAFGPVVPGACTFVDFGENGPGNGLPNAPFNTVASGVSATPAGGSICIESGTSAETITISKRLTIESTGGIVRIGQ